MVQYLQSGAKRTVIALRKRGLSYSEIQKSISVSKSTLSHWLKEVKLSDYQTRKLKQKRRQGAKLGGEKKKIKTIKMIEEIQRSSAKDISGISKRELWLMGIMLYWRERFLNHNESDLKRGVRFTSSDPFLIKLFLRWLQEVGHLKKDEINFDIFLEEDKKDNFQSVANQWAKITGFKKDNFSHFYFQKIRFKKNRLKAKRRISKKSKLGLLRIRVRASSMLARQISG